MAQTKALDIGARVDHVRWDYSAQYLAAAGPSGVSVQYYMKKEKKWSEPLRSAVSAVATAWGSRAGRLVGVSKEGVVTVLGAQ